MSYLANRFFYMGLKMSYVLPDIIILYPIEYIEMTSLEQVLYTLHDIRVEVINSSVSPWHPYNFVKSNKTNNVETVSMLGSDATVLAAVVFVVVIVIINDDYIIVSHVQHKVHGVCLDCDHSIVIRRVDTSYRPPVPLHVPPASFGQPVSVQRHVRLDVGQIFHDARGQCGPEHVHALRLEPMGCTTDPTTPRKVSWLDHYRDNTVAWVCIEQRVRGFTVKWPKKKKKNETFFGKSFKPRWSRANGIHSRCQTCISALPITTMRP